MATRRGRTGYPARGDSVNLGNGVIYLSTGTLTVGTVSGDLDGGTVTASDADDMTVWDGMLTLSAPLTLGAANRFESFGGVTTVDDSLTVNLGTLRVDGGSFTVDGDLNCTDVSGTGRGNVLLQTGAIHVTGTATFGEHSHVSGQFIIQSRPSDSLALFEAADLVFGSQTVATGQNDIPVYTGITFEDLELAGLLTVANTLTINIGSYITASDTTTFGAIATSRVQAGTLVDAGALGADGANTSIVIGASAQLLGGSLAVTREASLEIGGTGNAIAGGAAIDSGGSVVGAGSITTEGRGSVQIGTSASVPVYSKIANSGTIEAKNGLLQLLGNVSGAGTITIDAGSSLELGGSLDPGSTITFADPGQNATANPQTLIIDNPTYFTAPIGSDGSFDTTIVNGMISGLALDDEIIL